MTVLIRQSSQIVHLPQFPPLARLSPALDHALEQVRNPHPDIGAPKQFAALVKHQAGHAADELEAQCKPVPASTVRDWCRPIGAAVRNPPTNEDFAAWAAALMIVCGDLAVGVFTVDTQREALRAFQIFPAVADVSQLLGPKSHTLRARRDALRRIAESETEAPAKAIPVSAGAPAWTADRTMRAPSGPIDPDDWKYSWTQPPIRTPEEQIAILLSEGRAVTDPRARSPVLQGREGLH